MKDFSVRLSDRPGELAQVATALSRYGVNIKALAGLAIDGQVMVKCCLPRPTAVFFAAITVTGYELHLCQASC